MCNSLKKKSIFNIKNKKGVSVANIFGNISRKIWIKRIVKKDKNETIGVLYCKHNIRKYILNFIGRI